MLATITAIGGLAGLIVSTLLLALQTRAVAKQTEISNALAGASVLREAMTALRESHLQILFDYPELRRYFYDGRPLPSNDHESSRVIAAAEMLADTLETALHGTKYIPATDSYEDWQDYCRYMLTHSPVLISMVRQHPTWWPNMALLAEGH